jgi:hypothetical protein
MKIIYRQLLAALWFLAIAMVPCLGSAQTKTLAKAPTTSIAMAKKDMARGERSRSRTGMKAENIGSERKKGKNFSYSYLLPFGVGQFEQDKKILGTTLATAQAGFLLIYFDRLQQIQNANADSVAVMRGVDLANARNDPTILSFLDNNEAFVLKSQKEAKFAMLGFFALYSAGVVEAIFDPFSSFEFMGPTQKKRRAATEAGEAHPSLGDTRLVQQAVEERAFEKPDPRVSESQVGVFFQPAVGAPASVGISVQKPF